LGGLPKPARIAFFALFIYLFASFCLQQIEVLSLMRQVRALENRAAEISRANDLLREEIDFARSDAYIEQVAREQLGLIWPNEIPYAPGGRRGP
jgi:cell division protein DivIC